LVRFGLVPHNNSFLLQPGLAVVLCALAGFVPWTVAEPRSPAAGLARWGCVALSVTAAMVGTVALHAFWHKGMIYYDFTDDWTTINRVAEATVWLLWCLVSFGLFAMAEVNRAGRKRSLATGLVFFAAGLLFLGKWDGVERFILQLPAEESFMYDVYGNGSSKVSLPSPISVLLLGIGLMGGGLIARYLDGKPSSRQWLLHLVGGVVAGLTGFAAAKLGWVPISWEGLQNYQAWSALAGTGVTAFLLWIILPMLEKRAAATTVKP
jgi:hypothetical protein